jgi:hypothetical protein
MMNEVYVVLNCLAFSDGVCTGLFFQGRRYDTSRLIPHYCLSMIWENYKRENSNESF